MTNNELIKSKEELREIADALSGDLKGDGPIVSRYTRINYDTVIFQNGKGSDLRYANTNINREDMARGIYTGTSIDDLNKFNAEEVFVSRDLQDHRFNFGLKGIPLPTGERTFFESYQQT